MKQQIKKILPISVFRAIEPFGHKLEAMVVSARYGFPAKGLRIIGVTGTNGKTTTSFMIHRMLHEAGYKVGLMTTVAYGVGDDIHPQVAHMTTLSSPALNKRITELREQGIEWLVLETTSHALAQHRVWGVPYEIAVSTNITHEHLDYHGTFEAYKRAKQRLFTLAARHPKGFGVINADDPESTGFIDSIQERVTYGLAKGELQAKDIVASAEGSEYRAVIGDDSLNIQCRIPGEFNVYNSLAAVAVGRHIGLTNRQIEHGIAALDGVEGRMMTIDEGQEYSVVIDFAHTPDSFERLLSDLRASTKGKLVAVFGSAGRRDEAKRAIQGRIAGKYTDEMVITEEDDRDIDGNMIMQQIANGAMESGKVKDESMFLILDRTEAITFAIGRVAKASDTVVLLGKGHEKTIERADGEFPWDEEETARIAIKQASR